MVQILMDEFLTSSILDLSLDARLLYASQSIVDILGYTPQEVVGKSCWEYFHPDEIPFARAVHGRGVQLDKAAVLNYCQIKNRDGRWVGCECVFTIVHDVIIACTSIFRRGVTSQSTEFFAPSFCKKLSRLTVNHRACYSSTGNSPAFLVITSRPPLSYAFLHIK